MKTSRPGVTSLDIFGDGGKHNRGL